MSADNWAICPKCNKIDNENYQMNNMTQNKLKNPCYDGKNHSWLILERTIDRKKIKWCRKCGKEKLIDVSNSGDKND